jgi:hypothetical protein
MSRDISEITFFIAPLENGVQDFGIWKEPMKIDSWADPSFVKIEEVDMKDIQKVLMLPTRGVFASRIDSPSTYQ